jgi:hypothetical protein
VTAVDEFNLALDAFLGKQVPAIALAVQKKVALQAFRGVVKKSPVDTGRFRGNWHLTITPSDTATEFTDKQSRGSDPSGSAVSSAVSALSQIQPYGVAYLQNALPYAERLENGWSKQQPMGMVAVTLAELQGQFIDASGPSPEAPDGVPEVVQ